MSHTQPYIHSSPFFHFRTINKNPQTRDVARGQPDGRWSGRPALRGIARKLRSRPSDPLRRTLTRPRSGQARPSSHSAHVICPRDRETRGTCAALAFSAQEARHARRLQPTPLHRYYAARATATSPSPARATEIDHRWSIKMGNVSL